MSANKGAIANCGLVLKKLDASSPPSYATTHFTNRDALMRAVEDIQNIMTTPEATSGWTEKIADIVLLATTTMAYFDVTQNPNPAQAEFLQDWDRVKRLAG